MAAELFCSTCRTARPVHKRLLLALPPSWASMIPVYRVLWEPIAVENPRLKVCILTNATILDDSIRAFLKRINCWMHVSIDSVDKKTYESIRKGASFETVMENCRYYHGLMKQRGLSFMLRFCPMRLNWREIPDTVRYCNERGIPLTRSIPR